MNAARARLPLFAAALWWGSLGAIGFMAVPLLFASAPSPAIAGRFAARLFSAECWVGVVCGAVLLLCSRERGTGWARGAIGFVLAGMLLALLQELAVAPRIVARDNLPLWHSVGSAMYVGQWLCATVLLWKLSAARS